MPAEEKEIQEKQDFSYQIDETLHNLTAKQATGTHEKKGQAGSPIPVPESMADIPQEVRRAAAQPDEPPADGCKKAADGARQICDASSKLVKQPLQPVELHIIDILHLLPHCLLYTS